MTNKKAFGLWSAIFLGIILYIAVTFAVFGNLTLIEIIKSQDYALAEIASIGAISMLFIHMIVHIGHLLKRKETDASIILLILAIVTMATAIVFALQYTSKHIPNVGYFLAGAFFLAFIIEIALRIFTKRIIQKQTIR